MLAAEFIMAESLVTQPAPHQFFRPRFGLTELSGAFDFGHDGEHSPVTGKGKFVLTLALILAFSPGEKEWHRTLSVLRLTFARIQPHVFQSGGEWESPLPGGEDLGEGGRQTDGSADCRNPQRGEMEGRLENFQRPARNGVLRVGTGVLRGPPQTRWHFSGRRADERCDARGKDQVTALLFLLWTSSLDGI